MTPRNWDVDPSEDSYHADGPEPSDDNPRFGNAPDLNSSEIGKRLLGKIEELANQGTAGNVMRPAPLEHILTFDEGLSALKDVIDDIAQKHHEIWGDIAKIVSAATESLERATEAAKGKLTGATADAMFCKVHEGVLYLTSLAEAIARMDPLVDAFSRDMKETRDWFRDAAAERDRQRNSLRHIGLSLGEEEAMISPINVEFDNAAKRTIRHFYNPPISWVSHNHPDMTATPPQVGGGGGGAGSGPSSGGMGKPGGGGVPAGQLGPKMPDGVRSFEGPGTPEQPPGQGSAPTDAAKAATDAAKGATDAAGQAGQGATDALGKAGDAAKQALDQALQSAQQQAVSSLPEGVLGLGSKSGGPSIPKAGSGAGGGGVGAPKSELPKMNTSPTSTSSPTTATAASRSGLSGAAGSAGAGGAPAAGHRGGEGSEKVHKVLKALRTNKNGEEVVDETDANVAVIGGSRPEPAPGKSS